MRFFFTKFFLSGYLKGIKYQDSIWFPNRRMFISWIKRVNSRSTNQEFIILENSY